MLKEGVDVWNMPSNQASAHRSVISGSCGNGLKGVPLSQTLFPVAEDSKQDICVPQNVREAVVPCSLASRFKGLPAP